MEISIDRLRGSLPVNMIPNAYFGEIRGLVKEQELEIVKEIYNSDNYTVALVDNKLIKITNNFYEIRFLLNEYYVGLQLNSLRTSIPNFRLVDCIFIKDHLFAPEPNCLFLSCEHIDGLPYETIRDKDINYVLTQHIQVVLALYLASIKFDFTHYDLGVWNLLILPSSENKRLKYNTPLGTRFVECTDVSVIIDYEFSYIRGMKCTTDRPFAINDVFTLLVSTMKLFNDDRYKQLTKLLKFFTKDTDRDSLFKMKCLPYDKDLSITEYIIHFDNKFPDILRKS